jgi:hypothetical protein
MPGLCLPSPRPAGSPAGSPAGVAPDRRFPHRSTASHTPSACLTRPAAKNAPKRQQNRQLISFSYFPYETAEEGPKGPTCELIGGHCVAHGPWPAEAASSRERPANGAEHDLCCPLAAVGDTARRWCRTARNSAAQLPMLFPARHRDGTDHTLIAAAQTFLQSPPSVPKAERGATRASTMSAIASASGVLDQRFGLPALRPKPQD